MNDSSRDEQKVQVLYIVLKYRKIRITLSKIKNHGVRETFRLLLFNFKQFRAQSKIEIKKISDAKSQENNRYCQYNKKNIFLKKKTRNSD